MLHAGKSRVRFPMSFLFFNLPTPSSNIMDLDSASNRNEYQDDTSCSATHEPPNTSCNSKVLYRVHKNPPLILILSQMNPIHTTHLISLNPILILSSHIRLFLSSGLFFLAFSPECISSHLLAYICATCPAPPP
jgi:hypothetical protein